MLTLNTNAWWENIWNRVSNSFLWWYPDFKQILLKPSSGFSASNNVLSVNWTIVNNICSRLSEAREFIWTSTASNYGWTWVYEPWFITNTTWNNKECNFQDAIFTTLWQFEWWEVVWKEIYIKCNARTYSNSTAIITSWWNWHKISIWLLHTDWSITIIWTATKYVNFNHSSATMSEKREQIIETNWVVAQEGDRIIWICWWNYLVNVSNTSSNFWIYTDFWYDWSASSSMWTACTPIQISID